MSSDPVFSWRKSAVSTSGADCVELGTIRRKPGLTGAVRDSKNPAGPALDADLGVLVRAVKTGRLDH
jgi:hypothetical protein